MLCATRPVEIYTKLCVNKKERQGKIEKEEHGMRIGKEKQ